MSRRRFAALVESLAADVRFSARTPPDGRRPCVETRCNREMDHLLLRTAWTHHRTSGLPEEIAVDRCAVHGLWFDPHELSETLDLIDQAKGEPRSLLARLFGLNR